MNLKNNTLIAAILIVFAGVIARIVGAETHLYNFAPIAAVGLFSGSVINNKKHAFALAIACQFIADLYFALFTNTPGFYGVSQLFTYAALIGATALGTFLKNRKLGMIAVFSVGASVLFFLISNLGVYVQGWYGHSAAAFVQTYVQAIPFFKNALLGDLLGSAILFGSYALYSKRFLSTTFRAA